MLRRRGLLSTSSLIFTLLCSLDEASGSNRTVRQSFCGTNFECMSGECISSVDVCNGLTHCKDGSDELPFACGCGEKYELRKSGNAPGVRDAQLGTHPWHAGIFRSRPDSHFNLLCSGALIYTDIVLTSANCVIDPETSLAFLTSALFVSLGKLQKEYNVHEKHQQNFEVSKVVILDRYEGHFKQYSRNLALIKLKKASTSNYYVKPICLWTSKFMPTGVTTGEIAGWGLQFSGNYAINLREATTELIDVRTCSRRDRDALFKKYLTNDKFCLVFDQGIGLREEDTGGPVTVYSEGRHYLYGILSKRFGTTYGLGTLTSKYVPWIRNTTYYLKKAEGCLQSTHFNCLNDASCISVKLLCNGKNDCSDGSDEDPKTCSVIESGTYGQYGKKCIIPDDRREIFNPLKCSEPNGCSNKFSAPSNSKYQITCPEKYGFATPNSRAVNVVCSDGEWTPSLEDNRCLRLCNLEAHKSLALSCRYLGEEVSCNEPLKPNTHIGVDCKRQYKREPLVLMVNKTHCRKDGSIHNELTRCIPVCGKPFDPSNAEELISNAEKLDYAKYPWQVALYWKEEIDEVTQFTFKCGGTLIDSNKVLTAAHCVWKVRLDKIMESSSLRVVCGKLHSNWFIRDDFEQRLHVERVILGEHYVGTKTKYSHDIAVLILSEEVKLTDYIMPACLDLDGTAGGIPRNQAGHVIGWGSVSGHSSDPSSILREGYMNYLDLDSCRKRFEKQYSFTEYLHPDKFCALYINGTGTQSGDSGGGMTFTHDDLQYVYGVVSIKKGDQNDFAVFTNVMSHAAWLKNIINPK